MKDYRKGTSLNDYDYEEDDYDRLQNINSTKKESDKFTNKSKMTKFEFDYEEDHYEPNY